MTTVVYIKKKQLLQILKFLLTVVGLRVRIGTLDIYIYNSLLFSIFKVFWCI